MECPVLRSSTVRTWFKAEKKESKDERVEDVDQRLWIAVMTAGVALIERVRRTDL